MWYTHTMRRWLFTTTPSHQDLQKEKGDLLQQDTRDGMSVKPTAKRTVQQSLRAADTT